MTSIAIDTEIVKRLKPYQLVDTAFGQARVNQSNLIEFILKKWLDEQEIEP